MHGRRFGQPAIEFVAIRQYQSITARGRVYSSRHVTHIVRRSSLHS